MHGSLNVKFITMFTRACHVLVSSGRLTQSMLSHPIYDLQSYHLCPGLLSVSLPSRFTCVSLLSHVCHIYCQPHPPWLGHPRDIKQCLKIVCRKFKTSPIPGGTIFHELVLKHTNHWNQRWVTTSCEGTSFCNISIHQCSLFQWQPSLQLNQWSPDTPPTPSVLSEPIHTF
jgi:hypothetical protein